MESPIHLLSDLFRQLGLPDDPESIETFLADHRPLPPDIPVAEAAFWTPSQADFLREEMAEDGDWTELVDWLGVLLSR